MNATCPSCGITLAEVGADCPACGHSFVPFVPPTGAGSGLGTAQRIAGLVLVTNAVLVTVEALALDPPASDATPLNPLSAAIVDLVLGILLAAGHAGVLPWVKLRVVAGALILTGLYVASGDAAMAVVQLLFSGAVAALLFGTPGKARIAVSLAMVGVLFALGLVGIQQMLTGRNPLTPVVLRLTQDLRPVEGGTVRSASFPYQIAAPGEEWLLRAPADAHRDNPLADTWLVHPDYDAHIIVIAESLGGSSILPVEKLVAAVIENARGAAEDFRIHRTRGVESASGPGRLVDATGVLQGTSLRFHYGVFSFEGYAMQVVCFVYSEGFEHVADDFGEAIASLTLVE